MAAMLPTQSALRVPCLPPLPTHSAAIPFPTPAPLLAQAQVSVRAMLLSRFYQVCHSKTNTHPRHSISSRMRIHLRHRHHNIKVKYCSMVILHSSSLTGPATTLLRQRLQCPMYGVAASRRITRRHHRAAASTVSEHEHHDLVFFLKRSHTLLDYKRKAILTHRHQNYGPGQRRCLLLAPSGFDAINCSFYRIVFLRAPPV
jgi:hypothetical protein